MVIIMENPNFLKQKYWGKEEFRKAAEKSADKKGRLEEDKFSVAQKPEEQISSYVERIKKVAEKKGELFREVSLYPKYIIKPENISDDYVKNILLGNFAEIKGYDRDKLKAPEIKEQVLKMFKAETGANFVTYQIPKEQKNQIIEQIIKDQKTSLDRWFEYLTGSESENYPDEFKYWAFAEMLKLGAQDRDRKDFNKRAEDTAASFPELNQQALSLALDEVRRKYGGEVSRINLSDKNRQKEFKKRLEGENFGKLYGWALDYVSSLMLPKERLPITQGKWNKFSKGSTSKELADTLQGFNTGWCIAGEGTAESYLSHSDVWIYFSQDEKGENSIPRAAVISDGSRISEVRGIIQTEKVKQHLDDYITPIVEEKIKTLPGGGAWQTGIEDMKKLAEIHFKHIQKQSLDKSELLFLYEINQPIQSFGYGQDPRIEEIRKQRNSNEDAPVVFECEPNQIARKPEEITKNTKAYIGPLFKGVFQLNLEHISTSFPEGMVKKMEAELTGKSGEELERELKEKNISISSYASDMLKKLSPSSPEHLDLVRLTVKDLGFPNGATTDEIYKRAEELGLELCPQDTGPNLRLQNSTPDYMYIAMKQITDRNDFLDVFSLRRGVVGLWLDDGWAEPDNRWRGSSKFVFRSRKLKTKKL